MHEFNNLFDKISKNNSDFLITGPPGTDKHLFLADLVSYLINEKKYSPESILVFTFNRKTSKYYREKLAVDLHKSSREISFVTFYSFCLDILSIAYYENYLKDFFTDKNINSDFDFKKAEIKLLNAPEQMNLLREVINETDSRDFYRLSKLLEGNENSRSNIIGEIFDYIIKAQESLLKPSDTSKIFSPYFKGLLFEINKIYKAYDKKLNDVKAFNYGKLLQETAEVLKSSKETLKRHLSIYRHIIVDDLQELNNAQFEILNSISDNNVIYFGNDDESIFSFRSSNSNIFSKIYEKLMPDKVIFLNNIKRNSRSIALISEGFINKNKYRVKKQQNILKDNSDSDISISVFNNTYEELSNIEDKIFYLNKIKKISLNNIAIIIKGLESEAGILEDFFNNKKIPFYYRSSRSVLKSRYVKFITNIFKFISDYQKDDFSNASVVSNKEIVSSKRSESSFLFKKIMYSSLFNFDPLILKSIEQDYLQLNRIRNSASLFDYILKNRAHIEDRYGHDSLCFLNAVFFLQSILFRQFDSVFEAAYYIINSPKTLLSNEIFNYENNDIRDKNLVNTLGDYLNSLKKYCSSNPDSSISDYCSYIEELENMRFIEEIEESIDSDTENEGVRIISFYDTKIREFDAVFIPFFNKGHFPSSKEIPQIYDPEIFNMISEKKYFSKEKLESISIENDRKIVYAAILTTKNYLYISSQKQKGKSSFFVELSRELESLKKDSSVTFSCENTYSGKDQAETVSENNQCRHYSRNICLMKKKAVAAAHRQMSGRSYDSDKFGSLLNFLVDNYSYDNWWMTSSEYKNSKKSSLPQNNNYSYSSLEAYQSCPLKYKIAYYFKIKPETSFALIRGRIYHEIVRKFFNSFLSSEDINPLELLENTIADEIELNRSSFNYNFYLEEFKADCTQHFHDFFNSFIKILPVFNDKKFLKKPLIEQSFNLLIAENIKITGKIDFINFTHGNKTEIIDFKTSSMKMNEKDLAEELQLKLYRLAAEKSLIDTGINKNMSDIILKYYFFYSKSNPECIVPSESYDENSVISKVSKIVRKIKKEQFELNPRDYSSCKFCEFKIFCPRYYAKPI